MVPDSEDPVDTLSMTNTEATEVEDEYTKNTADEDVEDNKKRGADENLVFDCNSIDSMDSMEDNQDNKSTESMHIMEDPMKDLDPDKISIDSMDSMEDPVENLDGDRNSMTSIDSMEC